MSRQRLHNPPLFITFEGGEGAGKSTLMKRLQEYFTSQGAKVVTTREPGGTLLGDAIRGMVLSKDSTLKIGTKPELFLFLAARAAHVEELIRPSLAQGAVVLCDRFSDSSVAYQGYARGLGAEVVSGLSAYAAGHLEPDLTFYLDLAPEEGFKRMKASDRVKDRIEQEEGTFHIVVREGFLEIARKNPKRVKILDAKQSADTVFQEAVAHLEKLCGSSS